MTPAITCPKLKANLIIAAYQENGKTAYTLKEPLTRRYFRCWEEEFFILRQLDGNTPLTELGPLVYERYSLHTKPATIERFVARISEMGLLEEPIQVPSTSLRAPILFFRKYLFFRLRVYNPEPVLDKIAPYTYRFVSLWFLFLVLAIIGTAGVVAALNWNVLQRDIADHFRLGLVAGYWAIAVIVTVLHECAHAITCKRWGGEVREAGILFIYFNLAFYVNLSDAWLFTERYKRLAVMAAGGLFELFLWAMAALGWLVTARGWLHTLCVMVIAVTGLKTLFNWCPLIKLDGYYMLSDYFECPNLRARSFRYIKDLLWRRERTQYVLRKERVLFLTYGISAFLFSAFFMVFSFTHIQRAASRWSPRAGYGLLALWAFAAFGDLILTKCRDFLASRSALAKGSEPGSSA